MPPTGLVFVKKIRCDEGRAFDAPVGATAVTRGQIVKFTSGLVVPAASADKQLDMYLCLNTGAVSGRCLVVPLRHVEGFEITYTGSAPTIGAVYGITDGLTLSQADTTNKLLVVQSVDTAKTTAMVHGYYLTS